MRTVCSTPARPPIPSSGDRRAADDASCARCRVWVQLVASLMSGHADRRQSTEMLQWMDSSKGGRLSARTDGATSPPHARGWTRGRVEGSEIGTVDPRTSGDGPGTSSHGVTAITAAPHARGCTPRMQDFPEPSRLNRQRRQRERPGRATYRAAWPAAPRPRPARRHRAERPRATRPATSWRHPGAGVATSRSTRTCSRHNRAGMSAGPDR